MRHIVSIAIAAAVLQIGVAWGQGTTPSCGDSVTVQRGDTLSRIAERCNVSEAAILNRNPGIEGSNDLQIGGKIDLSPDRPNAERAAERLRSYANRAIEAVGGIARDLGSSVDDLLEKNPDLHNRLKRLGDQFGVSGGDAENVQVSLLPSAGPAGTAVTVEAKGLPKSAPVIIGGGGPRSAYEVLERARSTAEGTLTSKIEVPKWADDYERFVVVVRGAERDWKVSAPFRMTR